MVSSLYLQRKRLVRRLASLMRSNEYVDGILSLPAEEEAGEEVGEAEEEDEYVDCPPHPGKVLFILQNLKLQKSIVI